MAVKADLFLQMEEPHQVDPVSACVGTVVEEAGGVEVVQSPCEWVGSAAVADGLEWLYYQWLEHVELPEKCKCGGAFEDEALKADGDGLRRRLRRDCRTPSAYLF